MISRVEAGSHPVLKDEVDVSTIVADVAELYEPLAEEAGARVVVEGADRPIVTSVSRELIAQAISNLVDNAMKYAVRGEGETVVTVSLHEEIGICRLCVSDNGPGIPADKHDRVLERFYRLDESRSLPGSGLGLSLVQAIARVHGGTLSLEDAGPGLRVIVTFPMDGAGAADGEA